MAAFRCPYLISFLLIDRSLSEPAPGLVSARRAAALQQIAQAKQSQDPSEVLALLRAAEKFFSGSRPQLTQQISNLEAEEAQFRQRLFKAAASASKPAQELEPEREPALPEPQPEPEAEPPEPATRSVEAQGQTDALMSFSPESKPKKRKQKPRKQHAVSWQVAEERRRAAELEEQKLEEVLREGYGLIPPAQLEEQQRKAAEAGARKQAKAQAQAAHRAELARLKRGAEAAEAKRLPVAGGGGFDAAAVAAAEEETAVMPTSTPEAAQNDKAIKAEPESKVEVEAEAAW